MASIPGKQRTILWAVAAAAILCTACSNPRAAIPTALPTLLAPAATRVTLAGPPAGPVFLLIMENKEYADVVGSPDAPFLNRLAMDNTLYEKSYAISHPSLPNYLALLAGDTFGITSDCTDCFLDQPNLVDALESAGRTWTAYMEDLPAPCSLVPGTGGFLDPSAGSYALKHNPFLYFQDIRTNPARCNRVVPLTQFDSDSSTSGRMSDFVWITPNQQHDTHDTPVAEGDRWLADFVPRLLNSSAWHTGAVLIVTWDEGTTSAGCCGLAAGGHIPTVVVRAGGPPGVRISDPVTHYSTLRTIEDLLHVQRLGKSNDPAVRPLFDAGVL